MVLSVLHLAMVLSVLHLAMVLSVLHLAMVLSVLRFTASDNLVSSSFFSKRIMFSILHNVGSVVSCAQQLVLPFNTMLGRKCWLSCIVLVYKLTTAYVEIQEFIKRLTWGSRESVDFSLVFLLKPFYNDTCYINYAYTHIGGVMISMLASSAIDRGFEPKTIKLVFAAYPLSTQY